MNIALNFTSSFWGEDGRGQYKQMTTPLISHLLLRGRKGGGRIMKYIKPNLKIEEAQVVNMLAESLAINNDKTVDGSDALTKEDSWSMWDDEE